MSIMLRKLFFVALFFAFITLAINSLQLVPKTFAQVFQENDNRRYEDKETVPIHLSDKRKLVIWGLNPNIMYKLELHHGKNEKIMQYNIYYYDQQNCNPVTFKDFKGEENFKTEAYSLESCEWESKNMYLVMTGVLDISKLGLTKDNIYNNIYNLTIKARINNKWEIKRTVFYKVVDDPTITLSNTSIVAGARETVTLEGLTPNTTYTLQLYLENLNPVNNFKTTFTTANESFCVNYAQVGGGFKMSSCTFNKKNQSFTAVIEIDTTNYNCSPIEKRDQESNSCILGLWSRDNQEYPLASSGFIVTANPNLPVKVEVSPNPGYEGQDVKISARGCPEGTKVHFEWYKGKKTNGDGTSKNNNPDDPIVENNGKATFTKNNFSSEKGAFETQEYRVVATCSDGRSGETTFGIINTDTEKLDDIVVTFDPSFIEPNTPFDIVFNVLFNDPDHYFCWYYMIQNDKGEYYWPKKEGQEFNCNKDLPYLLYSSNETVPENAYAASQYWWPVGTSTVNNTYNITTQEEATGLPEGDYELLVGYSAAYGYGLKSFPFSVCARQNQNQKKCMDNGEVPVPPPPIPCEKGFDENNNEIDLSNLSNQIAEQLRTINKEQQRPEEERSEKYNTKEKMDQAKIDLNNLIADFNEQSRKIVRCTAIRTPFGAISTDAGNFIKDLLRVLLSISGGIVLLLIIRSGYQLMTSQGNPEKITEAKDRITSAIIGLLFLIFSLVILEVIGVDIFNIPGFSG